MLPRQLQIRFVAQHTLRFSDLFIGGDFTALLFSEVACDSLDPIWDRCGAISHSASPCIAHSLPGAMLDEHVHREIPIRRSASLRAFTHFGFMHGLSGKSTGSEQ